MVENPVIWSDYPDADVICVEDTYYMVSTTMHFMPGAVILRSYDLCHWEIMSYVYDTLDSTEGQKLSDGRGIYGKGMWAASLRHYKGTFYVCFAANDTGKTYLYQSESICGPWRKQYIEGFYHDCSLLFDDDGRIYIMYGNRQIYITELKPDLSAPLKGGLNRMVLEDTDNYKLGFEGTHLYKINGKYYAFFIHWAKGGSGRRIQACYMAESLEGEFKGGDILDDAFGYKNCGVAQGGIVQAHNGKWYGMLFQDMGAVGRCPVLVPMHFEDGFPVPDNGKVPLKIEIQSIKPGHIYKPLNESDSFDYQPDSTGKVTLKNVWQWNHEPDNALWSVTKRPGYLTLETDRTCINVIKAKNTLTQRMYGPVCMAEVQVDGSGLNNGDYAGICALQGFYGFLALTRKEGSYEIVLQKRGTPADIAETGIGGCDDSHPAECARVKAEGSHARLKIACDFTDGKDEAVFFYMENRQWKCIGEPLKMVFTLDHFTGYRFALAYYSSIKAGGVAGFSHFKTEAGGVLNEEEA